MSSPWITTSDDGERFDNDNLSTQKWLDGQVEGAKTATAFVRELAVTEFRKRNNERANELQEIADAIERSIVPELEIRAKQHRTDYPWRLGKDGAK